MKPTGVYLRRQEQRYMGEQIEIEEMIQAQPLWLINNLLFCYEGENTSGMRARKSCTFYNTKEHMIVTKKLIQMERAQEGK